ncbi:MAG: hypothetical protein KDA58_05625 [Planctomycetaceae bacterium]|nr:hypothetical protein [Planctomycetaceae bacterium]
MLGCIAPAIACGHWLLAEVADAAEPTTVRHEFEAEQPSWQVLDRKTKDVLTVQFRSGIDHRSGQFCEQLEFLSAQPIADCRIEHPLPRSRVFDELTLSVWVRSNCPNLRVALRLLFPHQIDPRTGQPLVLELAGQRYTQVKQWEQLRCQPTAELLQQRLIRAREELSNGVRPVEIDARDALVTDLIVQFDAPPYAAALLIDDLEFGPIVAPSLQLARVLPVSAEQPEVAPVKLEIGDRITRDGTPFFPLFTLHHGEELDRIANLGVNMVWIPDYTDQELLTGLVKHQLGAIATPPHPSREQLAEQSAALPPFANWTTPVWAWMLGIEIPEQELPFIERWAEQIQDADREFRRPLIGEVLRNQRAFHRNITFLGSTRIPMQTGVSPLAALKRAQRHRALALPGKATFSFVATEPTPQIVDSQPANRPFPALEPEQILMQSFAAIAAGYRGLGFWKQYSLDDPAPGMSEREHAMRLVCIQARLLESFFANGRIVDEVTVQIGNDDESPGRGGLAGNNPFASRWDPKILTTGAVVNPANEMQDLKAFVLHSDVGVVILPMWLEEHAQFVPGPRAARDVRMLFKGDATEAWEVTTTGITSQLQLNRIAGGTEVHLREFDQHSVIVVTHSQAALDELRQKSRQFRGEAARSWLAMAEAKLRRTADVHARLAQLNAPRVSQGDQLLQSSQALLDRAREQLQREDYDSVRRDSQRALQYLRKLQRDHWEHAVATLSSPQASPYTCCFQTLPAHWELLAEIGRRANPEGNLLPTGDFESQQEFVAANWVIETPTPAAGLTLGRVSLDPVGIEGRSALAFDTPYAANASASRTGRAVPIPEPAPLLVHTPDLPVRDGDIVLISGQVRIPQPLQVSEQGLLIYDSLRGVAGAMEWQQQTSGWQPFRMIREMPRDGSLNLAIEFRARGRVELDDLRVLRLPRSSAAGE